MPADKLFHERLMHTGQTEALRKEMKQIYGKQFEFIDHQCMGCIAGKGHDCVNQFKCYDKPIKRAGQEFHYDLFTYDKEDRDGNRYMLLIVDAYSGKIAARFLKSKKELAPELKKFCKKVEREIGKTPHAIKIGRDTGTSKKVGLFGVARLRSDGAGENSSNKLRRWFRRRGITNEWTVADNPKHNSVAERAGRTVMEGAESSRHSALLGPEYWSDMVRAFIYVYNRIPKTNRLGKYKTPYENYYDEQYDFKDLISPLRRIGCQCYAVQPHYKRKKNKQKNRKERGEVCLPRVCRKSKRMDCSEA